MFDLLRRDHRDHFTHEDITAFLEQYSGPVAQGLRAAVLRRLDKDQKGKVYHLDCCRIFGHAHTQAQGQGQTQGQIRIAKPSAEMAPSWQVYRFETPKKTKIASQGSPKYPSTEATMKSALSSAVKPHMHPQLPVEQQLGYIFNQLLDYIHNIQSASETLQAKMKPDQVFNVFANSNSWFLTVSDLDTGLRNLGLSEDPLSLFLLLHRYDRNLDGLLSFAEFAAMLQPIDSRARQVPSTLLVQHAVLTLRVA